MLNKYFLESPLYLCCVNTNKQMDMNIHVIIT